MLHQHFIKVLTFCLLLFIFTACVSNRNSGVQYDYDHGYYTVLLGDTLYSIAWRHRIDYKQLARWNRIRPPYTIYAGQRLRITKPPGSYTKTTQPKSSATAASKKKKSSSQVAKTTSTSASKKKSVKPVKHDWIWPTKGKVIKMYSTKLGGSKGIDIAGKLGQPVFAASAGKVVYSGNGLSGYGNLIIVKHSEQYLSAYAHNKKLFVKEGGMVKRGEKIAELGSSGTSTPKLHFEIRYNGKPVDPIKHLPKN